MSAITDETGTALTTEGGDDILTDTLPPDLSTKLMQTLRVRVGLLPTDTSKDAELIATWATAMAMAENHCNRKFMLQDDSETVTHFAGYSYNLRRYPMVSLTSVVADRRTVEPSYHNDLHNGILFFDGRLCAHTLLITWRGGYDIDAMPADLFWALLHIFDAIWAAGNIAGGAGPSIGAVKQAKIGDLSISYETGASAAGEGTDGFITSSVANVLNAYRRYAA